MKQRLNQTVIEAAIRGFEADRERINAQIEELRGMLNGNGNDGSEQRADSVRRKRRKFSPDAIKRMREAQQRRWARARGESQPTQSAATTTSKPRRKLSAAARAKLVANLAKARRAKAVKAKAVKRAAAA